MPKKKRLIFGVVLLLAILAGTRYGYGLTAFIVFGVVVLLGILSGARYALAHIGVGPLAETARHFHLSALVERVKASEQAGQPFSFVVLGDNRGNVKVPPVLFDTVKKESPVFVVNTGDLVRFGTAREYARRYLPWLDQVDPIPVLSVPGNHDRGARNDFAAYRAVYEEEQFSFDYGPCRFVGINNARRARMQAGDLEFLRRELSKSPIAHKFVFIHIPPRYFEDDVVTVKKRRGFRKFEEEFRSLMAEQQVTEVFMGHIHGYATKVIDGVRYTLTAGAGAPFSKQLPLEARVHHYVVIRVTREGLQREVVRCIDGRWIRGV